MTEQNYPLLVDLEIHPTTKWALSQEEVDGALKAIYVQRPDLFAQIAEREKQEGGDLSRDYGPEFYCLCLNALSEQLPELASDYLSGSSLLFEAYRRVCKMYDIPPKDTLSVEERKGIQAHARACVQKYNFGLDVYYREKLKQVASNHHFRFPELGSKTYVLVDTSFFTKFFVDGEKTGWLLWNFFIESSDFVIIPDHIVAEIGQSSRKNAFRLWLEMAQPNVIIMNTPTGQKVRESHRNPADWKKEGWKWGADSMVEIAEGDALSATTAQNQPIPVPDFSKAKFLFASHGTMTFGEEGLYSLYANQHIVVADVANNALETGTIGLDPYLSYAYCMDFCVSSDTKVPPLPELSELLALKSWSINEEDYEVMKIIYALRPEYFARLADRQIQYSEDAEYEIDWPNGVYEPKVHVTENEFSELFDEVLVPQMLNMDKRMSLREGAYRHMAKDIAYIIYNLPTWDEISHESSKRTAARRLKYQMRSSKTEPKQ